MMRRTPTFAFITVFLTAMLLTACGSDTEPGEGNFADEAADILEDQGIETAGGPAKATLTLAGATYDFTNDEPFGCFLTESGGSMGAIDFTAELEDGTEFAVEWAGDTPELSSRLQLMFPGGSSGWNLGFNGQFSSVEITGSNATVSGTVTRFGLEGAGEQAEATVQLSCP